MDQITDKSFPFCSRIATILSAKYEVLLTEGKLRQPTPAIASSKSVVEQEAPSALMHTVTLLPRRTASDLARASVAIRSLVVEVKLDDAIMP